jgi:hypothetical protein
MNESRTLSNGLAASWRAQRDRMSHDSALRDPRVAAEHAIADRRATSRGEAGCEFCHS